MVINKHATKIRTRDGTRNSSSLDPRGSGPFLTPRFPEEQIRSLLGSSRSSPTFLEDLENWLSICIMHKRRIKIYQLSKKIILKVHSIYHIPFIKKIFSVFSQSWSALKSATLDLSMNVSIVQQNLPCKIYISVLVWLSSLQNQYKYECMHCSEKTSLQSLH